MKLPGNELYFIMQCMLPEVLDLEGAVINDSDVARDLLPGHQKARFKALKRKQTSSLPGIVHICMYVEHRNHAYMNYIIIISTVNSNVI